MKNIFQSCIGAFLALLLFIGFGLLVCFALAAGIANSAANKKGGDVKIANGSYLVLDVSGNLTDAPPPLNFGRAVAKLFGGDSDNSLSLREVSDTLRAASKDSRIGGVFLTGSFQPQGYGAGFAALKELREALADFRKSGKKAVSYMVTPTRRDFYLMCAADTVVLNPFAEFDASGFSSEPTFFGNALKKYGVQVQVTRVGKYKSAVEPFITDKMSPESREQTQLLLSDLWAEWRAGVEQSRQVSAAKLQELADTQPILSPTEAKQAGLVTDLMHLPEVIEKLRQEAGSDSENTNTFRQVKFADYRATLLANEKEKGPKIGEKDTRTRLAIVYAEGNIVDGASAEEGQVAGERYARALRRLRLDNNVKAIVLRVNSPGGSALASELIQRELLLAKGAGKTVVVSMGAVAASGGYWISTASDRIFAEPNTITGSIGVFGLLPSRERSRRLVGRDLRRGEALPSLATWSRFLVPRSPEEMAQIQRVVDRIYDDFLDRVAKARGLTKDKVGEIAQGRVWSGAQAIKLGLVDELGGLEQAIAFARKKAGLGTETPVEEYPKAQDIDNAFAELFQNKKRPFSRIFGGESVTERTLREAAAPLEELATMNDPMGVYARMPFGLDIR